jgi:tetratricopeptide (TPR) repeat protein
MADTFERIQSFLAAVRRALRKRAAARAVLYAVAGLLLLSLIVPLLAGIAAAHRSPYLAWLGVIAAGIMVTTAVLVGLLGPLRRWRHDRDVARFVGQNHPALASDLLSAVELGSVGPEHAARTGRVSVDLVNAHIAGTARRVASLEARSLVQRAPVRRAMRACAVALAVHVAVLVIAPGRLSAGWTRVLHPRDTRPFGGADMSSTPLVGDIRITLEYPAHTRRPPAVLPSSSGDFRAMAGTMVTMDTTALVPVAAARMLFEESGPDTDGNTEVTVEVVGKRTLRARFPVMAAAGYRFLIESPGGKRHVEVLTRQIEIEPDRTPEVALYAPADELDVTSLRRIELAYIAEDDHGIDKVELVWDERGTQQRKALTPGESQPTGEPPRRAQGKFLWDLAEVALEPGVQVSYHLEVTDNDAVLGPNVGRSRSFKLRVFSPREKHEQLIARQQEFFEKLIRSLGGRLTTPAEDVRAHAVLQRESAALVVELGTLLTALGGDELADKDLSAALDKMRTRMGKLVKDEDALLSKLQARQDQGGSSKQIIARLATADAAMIAELEDDIIQLADWLDRQNMENLLAISDEMKVHQDRLRQLFKEYERTGSPELLAEIEREMRVLEKRLAEMAHKRGQMAEDVLDRFVNSDAIEDDEVTDCMGEVRALMAAGQVDQAQKKLETCMGTLDKAAEAMEQALRSLRSDKFSDEERKFGEVMDRLADLARDQRDVAETADDIWNRYAARADELMREEAKETRKQVSKLLDRLRKQLGRVPESGLTPFAKEELAIVGSRLQDLDRMLADGDIAEALAMAEQARGSLETTGAELDAALADEQDEPWGDSTKSARREIRRAEALADELVEELKRSTPSPGEIMSKDDRRQLETLRRRQQGLEDSARKLAERARELGGDLPGRASEAIEQGLGTAGDHMGRAQKRMRAQDPSGARQESGSAAEALERTLGSARDAARGRQAAGRAGLRDEPIRIPGADEYKAPQKFREDILEAMKREQAPEGFGELVKRYYEELIR